MPVAYLKHTFVHAGLKADAVRHQKAFCEGGIMGNRILLIDHSPLSLALMLDSLQSAGFLHIDAYTQAEQALQAVSGGARPSVIIVDFDLPGIDGVCLLDAIRRICSAAPGVIIADSPENIRGGCNGYTILDKESSGFFTALTEEVGRCLTEGKAGGE